MPSVVDLLMPGGTPVGSSGDRSTIRVLPGDRQAAQDFFDAVAAGGAPVVVAGYPGRMVDLPGGGRVGLRPVSKGGPPTIDVDVPGVPIIKLKFV